MHSDLRPEALLRPLDLSIIALYVTATLGAGIWISRNQRTAGDYFLGARNLPAWAILLSIVATETSALTVISVPGLGARGDLSFLQLALGYLVGRAAVAMWLLPGYFTGTQETAYARLESRFGAPTRRVTAAVFLITRFLADAVRLFAGAIPLTLVTGWSLPVAVGAMGAITLMYTLVGGLRAVVWLDVVQLTVYLAGGVAALAVAWSMAGGPGAALALAAHAGKLTIVHPALDLTTPYSLLGGLLGGALLSAASHGTDHLIVQRLLASRTLRDARFALVGSGVMVILQFTLFLLVGSAIWAAGQAPDGILADQIFPRFIAAYLPVGIAGLVVAGILSAAMGTHSSAINALASSVTHDLYAGWTGRTDPAHLLRVGRWFSALWGVGLVLGALWFITTIGRDNTSVVVLALSIASVTYGGLLGVYLLAGGWRRATGRDAVGALTVSVPLMLVVLFAARLALRPGWEWIAPLGRLAFPWYVPLGTLLTLAAGAGLSYLPHRRRAANE